MSYKRPVIVEIYADLYLEAGTLPFGRFFEVVPQLQKNGFPVVEAADVSMVEGTSPSGQVGATHRVRCWSEDRSRLVQLAPDNVAMNLVSPDGTYPGWDAFISSVTSPTLQSLAVSLGSWNPQSVGLHVLDRVTVSYSPAFSLGTYLNCGGPRIPSILGDTAVAFDYDIGRGLLQIDGKNRQIHMSGRVNRDVYLIEMHSVLHDRVADRGDLGATLDRLHDESVEWFESLITDTMRNDVMQGEVHASSRL